MRAAVEAEAQKRGYRNTEHLLTSPPDQWRPEIPVSEIRPLHLEKAAKLQRAFAGTLVRMNDISLASGEIERAGLAEYRAVFGQAISARHWRRLLERILERDGGAEDFSRLEIYLDESAFNKPAPSVPTPSADQVDEHLRPLKEIIASFADPFKPSTREKDYLWIHSIETLDFMTQEGLSRKQAKTAVLAFLVNRAPFLAANSIALKWAFERKFRAWVKAGRVLSAITDKRSTQSGNRRSPALSEADKLALEARSLLCGGRIAQAWRELLREGKLSREITEYYRANPSRKSYVPLKVLGAVKHEVKMLDDIHHGPKRARLNGAYIERDPSGEFSGDWQQGDDLTACVYYFDQGEEGLQIVRSQVLLMIDVRSLYALGFVLTGTPSYSAFHIRNLISCVHDQYGLPRRGWYFENGSWRARIVTGRKDEVGWAETEMGLRGLGLEFRHARLARAKVVENVMGAIQNRMEGEPGYCGRIERLDGFERMEQHKRLVLSGKAAPEEFFMSRAEWFQRLDAILRDYNSDPQQGKYCQGLSPRDAYERFSGPAGLVRLPQNCRYLLANHRIKVQVGRNGICFRHGKQSYAYRNEQTGALKGRTVLAWFNPEFPEILHVTDVKFGSAFSVERVHPIPAMSATDEDISAALAKNAQHDAYAKALYKAIVPEFSDHFMRRRFKPVLVDRPEYSALGEAMKQNQERMVNATRKHERLDSDVLQKARRLGFSAYGMARDPERASRGLDLMEAAERLHAGASRRQDAEVES